MAKLIYKSGDTYSSAFLTGKAFRDQSKRLFVEAMCLGCSKLFYTRLEYLISGKTKSCGCLRTKHGMVGSRLYRTWNNMIARCNYKPHESYPDYGGSGIIVCPEWETSFIAFMEWSFANGWDKHLTIDRFPNKKGNYEPSNCRWATQSEQNRNKGNNVLITAFGETKCLQDWVEDNRVSVARDVIMRRIKKFNWSNEKALIEPLNKMERTINQKNNVKITAFGVTKCLMSWLDDPRCIVGENALRQRISRGWDHTKSLISNPQR